MSAAASGRTPMIGHKIRDFLPEEDLLSYREAILRVYNLYGRRDNKFKARIKILVHETGADEIAARSRRSGSASGTACCALPEDEIRRIQAYFALPGASAAAGDERRRSSARGSPMPALDAWVAPEHRAASRHRLRHRHDLAEADRRHARRRHRRPDGPHRRSRRALQPRRGARQPRAEPRPAACRARRSAGGLRGARRGEPRHAPMPASSPTSSPARASTIARSPTPARSRSPQRISERFADHARQKEIGELKIKISGCINACGHHHVGHIGILGVEKKGEEFYQLTLGGSGDETRLDRRDHRPRLLQRRGDRRGRDAGRYLSARSAQSPDENFLAAYRRLGQAPFKEALYGAA